MQLVDFIDYRTIFERAKINHLKEFPTKESYEEYLKENEENFSFVKELYTALTYDFKDLDTDSSETSDDLNLSNWLSEGMLWVEFSEGGNNANESGDNHRGYGFQFKINLEEEIFVDYSYENYG